MATLASGTNPYKKGSPPDFGTLYSGRALEFDGVADFVKLGNNLETWTESTTKTMSVWVQNGGNTSEARIFNTGKNASADTAFGFGLDGGSTDNKPFYFLRDTGGGVLKEEFGDVCNTTSWYHFAIVQDGSNDAAYFYQNGVLKLTLSPDEDSPYNKSVGEIIVASPDEAKIGKHFDDNEAYYFNGKICNLQIWDKAWSESDVQYDYTHPEKLITDNGAVTSGITTSNLKGWYPMTEGAPRSPRTHYTTYNFTELGIAKIYDGSSDSNHGTTTFYGMMSDLLTSAQKTALGDALDSTNDTFDFATGTTNLLVSNGFTASGGGTPTATFVNASGAGLLTNEESAQGTISLPIATVANRSYQVKFDTGAQNSNIEVSLSSSATFNASNTSGAIAASQTAQSLTTNYVADDTTTFLVIRLSSSTDTQYANIDNLKVWEVGVASGWTTTDAEPLIPQTALMGYSKPMVFDGYANSVNCGIITEITPANNLTVSLWYYAPNLTNQDTFFCRRVEDGNDNDSIKLYLNDNLRDESDPLFKRELVLYIKEGGVKYARKVSWTRDSDWHHLVWSWDTSGSPAESKNALYIDGVSQTLTSASTYSNSGSYQSFYIGTSKDSPSTATFFKGMMNEVAIFNAVLSLTQVQELFNNGVPFDLDGSTLTGSPSLINYWRNTGAGTWTDLKGSDDGTPTGTPETILLREGVTKGKDILGFPLTRPNNGWLNLDGNEYVNCGDNDLFTFIDGGFSLECWFKIDITPTANTYLIAKQSVDAAANGDDAEYGIWITTDAYNDKRVYFRIQDDSASAYIGAYYNTPLTPGIWYHIVCTHTVGGVASSDCKIYLGETDTPTSTTLVTDVDSGTGTYVAMENATDGPPVVIGARSDATLNFVGSIDEVRIYNRALSATEITKNYNYGKAKHS